MQGANISACTVLRPTRISGCTINLLVPIGTRVLRAFSNGERNRRRRGNPALWGFRRSRDKDWDLGMEPAYSGGRLCARGLPVEFINWTGCRRLVCRPRDRMDWTSRRDGEDSQRRVSGRRERIALRGDSGCSCRGWSSSVRRKSVQPRNRCHQGACYNSEMLAPSEIRCRLSDWGRKKSYQEGCDCIEERGRRVEKENNERAPKEKSCHWIQTEGEGQGSRGEGRNLHRIGLRRRARGRGCAWGGWCGPCHPTQNAGLHPRAHYGWWSWSCEQGRARGCSWWKEAKRYRLCSSKEGSHGWDSFGSGPGDQVSPRRIGGYKRWRGEQLDAEDQERRIYVSAAAGPSRAVSTDWRATEKEERKREERANRSAGEAIERRERRQEKEKEEEEKRSAETRRRWTSTGETRPWRIWGVRFKQFRQREFISSWRRKRRGFRGGLRPFMRASLEKEGQQRSRERTGYVGKTCARAAGQGSADGGRRKQELSCDGHKDCHVLWPVDQAIPSSRESPSQGTVLPGPSHRPAEARKATRSRRRLGCKVYRCPHGVGRRRMADGVSAGTTSSRTCSEHQHSYNVAGAETPAAGLEKSRSDTGPLVGRRSRKRLWRPGEGEERRSRERPGKRQRQRREGERLGKQRREQSMEGEQGRSAKEIEEKVDKEVLPMHGAEGQSLGLAKAVPSAVVTWKGTAIFKQVLGRCATLDEVGRALAWALFNCPGDGITDAAVRSVSMVVRGRQKAVVAMHRGPGKRHRSLFPLPLGILSQVREQAQRCGLEEFSNPHFAGITGAQVWQALSVGALNGLAGFDRAPSGGRGTERQKKAVENLGHVVQHALKQPFVLDRSAAAAEKELSGRFLTYTGEEVPKMQVLGKEQVEAALPPKGHGGSISAVDLVCEGTKRFLLHPEESLLNEPIGGEKL